MAEEIQREGFGPNEWLVDEMYRRYQENPKAVAESWQEFFADYAPKRSSRPGIRAGQEAPSKGASDGSRGQAVQEAHPIDAPVDAREREEGKSVV